MDGLSNRDRYELLHDEWPGYRRAFWIVFLLALLAFVWIMAAASGGHHG